MTKNYTDLSTWQYRPDLSVSSPYIDTETGVQTNLAGYETVVTQRAEELKDQVDVFSVSDRLVHEGGFTLSVAAEQAFSRDVGQNYSSESIAKSITDIGFTTDYNLSDPTGGKFGAVQTEFDSAQGLGKAVVRNPETVKDALKSFLGRAGWGGFASTIVDTVRGDLIDRRNEYLSIANEQARLNEKPLPDYYGEIGANWDEAGKTALDRLFDPAEYSPPNDNLTIGRRLDEQNVQPVNAQNLTHLGRLHFYHATPRVVSLPGGTYLVGGNQTLTIPANTYFVQPGFKALYTSKELNAGEKTYNMVRDQTQETSLAHADFQSAQNVSSMSVPFTPPEKAFQTAVRMSGMLPDDFLSMNGFKSIKDFNTHLETSRNVLVHEYGRTAVQAMGKLTKEGIVFDENRVKEVAKNRAFADPNKTRGKHAPIVAEQIAGEVEMAKSMNMSHTEYVGWSREMDALINEVTDYTATPPEDDPMMSPDFDWGAFARNVENASAQQPLQSEESLYSPAHAQTFSKAALEQALDGLSVDPSMQSAPVEQDFVTAPSTPQRPPAELAKQARTNVQDMTYGEVMGAMNSPDYVEFAHPNGQSTFNAIRDWDGWKQDNPKDYSPPASQATAPQRSTPRTPAPTDYAAIDAMGDISGMMSKPDGTSVRAAQQSYDDIVAKQRKEREDFAKAEAAAAKEKQRKEQETLDRWKAAEESKQQRVAENNQDAEKAAQTKQAEDAKAALATQKRALREEKAALGTPPPEQSTTLGDPLFEKTNAAIAMDLKGAPLSSEMEADIQAAINAPSTKSLTANTGPTRAEVADANAAQAKRVREARNLIGGYGISTTSDSHAQDVANTISRHGGLDSNRNFKDGSFRDETGRYTGEVGVDEQGHTVNAFGIRTKDVIGYSGSDSGKNTRVICTELVRQKMMSPKLQRLDMAFTFARLSPTHVKGYHAWAIPYVRLMRQPGLIGVLATAIMEPLAQARAEEVAYQLTGKGRPNLFGKLVRFVGEPLCWAIGRVVEMGEDKEGTPSNVAFGAP